MKTKAEILYDAVTGIDERFVEEAEAHPAQKRRTWTRWTAAAAVLALMVGLGVPIWFLRHGSNSTGDGSASDDGYYSIYAGPVLPMTALGDLDGLTVTRAVSWDFSRWQAEVSPGTAVVTDRYVLTNETDREKTLTLCYPVSGSLDDETRTPAAFTLDGAAVTPDFHLGHGVVETADHTLSWNEYRDLLTRPDNLAASLSPEPELDLPAVVYTLAEEESGEGATDQVELRFRVDPAKTGVFVSDVTSCTVDDQTGAVTLRFSVDRRAAASGGLCALVLVGEDLEDPVLDAGAGTGTWRLEQQQTTLAAVIEAELAGITGIKDFTLPDLDKAAIARLLEDRGLPTLRNPLSDGPALASELASAAAVESRVMYETLEVSVPARGSVTVEAVLEKKGSVRSAASAQRGGDEGYDLLTRAGSELTFSEQTASVTGLDRVKIKGNNFGFDPSSGITSVTLDPEVPCYWMQVRGK